MLKQYRSFATSLLAAFLMMCAGILNAQDYRARVQGLVTDPSSAVIAGAKVSLLNEKTGLDSMRQTDSNGRYLFDFVEPGAYTVAVEATGFSRYTQKSILVQTRGDVTVDVPLQLSGMAETVQVSEQTVEVQFNTANMEMTVDRKMLTDLPIMARSPFTLAMLNPAVMNTYWTERLPFYMYAGACLNIGGNTSQQNEQALDGSPLILGAKGSYTPPMDAVQEFALQINTVDAEFGHNGGGAMSIATKSGNNEYHGTAYYFGRNPMFNAVPNSLSHTPDSRRNHIWGGSLGNPIKKNKLFTFTAWEQWRTRTPMTQWSTQPTDAERTGDFSGALTASGAQRVIYDPFSTKLDPVTGVATRTPFAGNIIPSTRIDPTAAAIMNDVWKPNNPGDNLTGIYNFKETFTNSAKYWNLTNRTDWSPTEKLRLFGRYSQFQDIVGEDHTVQSRALPFDNGGAMYALNVAGDLVYTLSPTTVINASGSYTSNHDDYDAPAKMSDADLASIWKNGWYKPYTKDLPATYYPFMIVGQWWGPGTTYLGHRSFWYEHPNNYAAKVKIAHTQGSHTLKGGLEYRRLGGMINYPSPWAFVFDPQWTSSTYQSPDLTKSGDAWATLLTGAIGSGQYAARASYNAPLWATQNYYGLYFQDDYKLNRNITLNLGLRYELNPGPTDAKDRFSRYLDMNNPIPELQGIQMPSEVTAIAQVPYKFNGAWVFTDENNRALYQSSRKAFMPRIGLAMRLNDKMALRVGYARYVVPPELGQAENGALTNFLQGYTVTSYPLPALAGVPQATISDPFPSNNPLQLPVGKGYGRYTNLGGYGTFTTQNYKSPVNERVTVSLQRQLPGQFHMDAIYYLSLGYNYMYPTDGYGAKDLNQMDPNLSYTYKSALDTPVANPFYNLLPADKMPGGLRNQQTVSIGTLLRPYPHYQGIYQQFSAGAKSHYNAFQLRLQRAFAKGFSTLASYQYTNQRDGQFFNSQDVYADKLSLIDNANPRHRLNLSGTYDLPFGKGRPFLSNVPGVVNAVLGGWSSSWIMGWNSGNLLTFGQAIMLGDPLASSEKSPYFNPDAFGKPDAYTPRTNPMVYPHITGPNFWNLDMSLSKYFPITERMKLEFKMEAYNATNSFLWGNPDTTIGSSTMGVSSYQANTGRSMQYTARLHF